MPINDPLAWDRQVKSLAEYDDNYRLRLRTDPMSADPSGPFIGVPPITERAALVQLRELPEDLPLRQALLRWAFRLADSRVNAPGLWHMARFWRSDPITLEIPQRIATTRSSILLRSLRELQGRAAWLSALGDQLVGATQWVSEIWQRREELAKRAGFAGVSSVIDPVHGMNGFGDAWLARTKPISTEVLPHDPVQSLQAALAVDACRGWPARISAPSMAALLGDRCWFGHAPVREPAWPQLIGPTSFVRALHRLGQELMRAWAPNDYPYAVGHDPWHLAEFRLGCLVASLVVNENWQRRVLRLSRDQANVQARAFAGTLLHASLCLCLKLRLRRAAIESKPALGPAYVEQTMEVLGFEWPTSFAGYLPRLRIDDAQRLLGLWLGLSDHMRLIQTFDEDWYRNPRAIETLLGQSQEIHQLTPPADAMGEVVDTAARWLAAKWP